jgi:hypothetical protein
VIPMLLLEQAADFALPLHGAPKLVSRYHNSALGMGRL